jgi:AraC-like DNA-binding protein
MLGEARRLDGLVLAFTRLRDQRVATVMVRTLALGLARLGVDKDAFLAAVGVHPEGDEPIPSLVVARALNEIAHQRGIARLGIELARNISLGWLGNIDYAFSTSATLSDALANVARQISKLANPARFEFTVDAEEAHYVVPLLVGRSAEIAAEIAVMQEFTIAFHVRRLRDVLGEDAAELTRVYFTRPAPEAAAAYESFFKAPISFDAPYDGISFRRALLDAPLLTAHPELARTLAEASKRGGSPAALADADPFLDEVRAVLGSALEHGQSAVGVEVLAAELGTSGRVLQRRLKERNVSLTRLVDDVRRERAAELLEKEGVLLCDVAYSLGFSGLAPFFRAFRRWTGASPREFQLMRGKA